MYLYIRLERYVLASSFVFSYQIKCWTETFKLFVFSFWETWWQEFHLSGMQYYSFLVKGEACFVPWIHKIFAKIISHSRLHDRLTSKVLYLCSTFDQFYILVIKGRICSGIFVYITILASPTKFYTSICLNFSFMN